MSEVQMVSFDEKGLIPAVVQDADTNEVLMLAWMNRESLRRTVDTGEATYWSRSRRSLWRKGETSGHVQKVVEIRLDCDADCVLLRVEQAGGIACHTGRRRCFYRQLGTGAAPGWRETEPVLQDPGRFRDGR